MVVQPIADRVAPNREMMSNSFSTYQNSAHGICDEYKDKHGTHHTQSDAYDFIRKFRILVRLVLNRSFWKSSRDSVASYLQLAVKLGVV